MSILQQVSFILKHKCIDLVITYGKDSKASEVFNGILKALVESKILFFSLVQNHSICNYTKCLQDALHQK